MISPLQQAAHRNELYQNSARLGDFARLVKCLMSADGKLGNAVVAAQSAGLSPELQRIIASGEFESRAAQNPLTLSNLSDYAPYSAAFVGAMVNTVLDQLLPFMTRVPVGNATVGAVSVNASAFSVEESGVKPATRFSLVSQNISPIKAGALIAVSKELARANDATTVNFVIGLLRNVLGVGVDTKFFATIASGVTPLTSSGTSVQSIKNDISNLLQAVDIGSDSRLFFITTPLVATMLTTILSDQSPSFAAVTPLGGMLAGLPLKVSDGVTAHQLLLVDCAGLIGNAGEVFPRLVEDAILQMDTVPDSPPTSSSFQQSLWQQNQVGVLLERFFVAARARSDAVQIIQTTNSYTGGSP